MPKVERGRSEEELIPLRHSTAHVMAGAVLDVIPEAKLGIGPAIKDGFYYDFDLPRPLTPEDLQRIEARMREVVKLNVPFTRESMSREEGLRYFGERKQPYKVELIEGFDPDEGAAGGSVSIYKHANFVDLCKGPHLERTGEIKAFKLMSIAGAYWRGDEHKPMLQRIYGTAWPSQADLDAYLAQLAEVERRDHRKLGRDLDLFNIDDELGSGLVLWLPNLSLVREELEAWWRRVHHERGYTLVYTPHIASERIYQRSGHIEKYGENMYGPLELEEHQRFWIKPMNCPGHVKVFQSRVRSYRELPLRIGELGTVYRYERSGTLHGMLRVRGFTQDDSHIFCSWADAQAEIGGVFDLAMEFMKVFGYSDPVIYLSTRPAKRLGTDEMWDKAEGALCQALRSRGVQFKIDEGGGVFYAPKIDIKMRDAIGREWQGPTIQVDLNLPERFDVTFVNEKGDRERPVMIHRVLYGSLERFVGGLIEHYAGNFPLWLSWLQVVVIPIRAEQNERAREVVAALRSRDFRAEVDDRPLDMREKIKQAQGRKANYMLLIGNREAGSGAVSIRPRHGPQEPNVPLEDFLARLEEERRTKALPQDFHGSGPTVAEAVAEQRAST
ncbi:MAG: threonine--tRNA ligase [Chloroflexi bacterium 13_1_40CM_4_68_4]|nr:MAG: threonine--tRNA ligase [Chloroflexi bacterium 13_1_40CM_4_68_4]